MPGNDGQMKKRVVIIDDEEVIRLALSRLFRRRGFEVISCPDALSGSLSLHCNYSCPSNQTCADIVIADVNMPKVTGTEFIRERMRQGCSIRHFAVMSATLQEAFGELSELQGIRLFEKPFPAQELINWIDECEKKIDPLRELALLPLCLPNPDNALKDVERPSEMNVPSKPRQGKKIEQT
jgi:DNA-binding NtrC family response regulator